jgi:hypothetical protein
MFGLSATWPPFKVFLVYIDGDAVLFASNTYLTSVSEIS